MEGLRQVVLAGRLAQDGLIRVEYGGLRVLDLPGLRGFHAA